MKLFGTKLEFLTKRGKKKQKEEPKDDHFLKHQCNYYWEILLWYFNNSIYT